MLLALVSLSRLLAKILPDAGDAVGGGGRRNSINDAAEPGATCSDAQLAPALSRAPIAEGSA